MREWILAGLLVVAAGLIVTGISRWSDAAAFVVAGVLLSGWSWLVFGDIG